MCRTLSWLRISVLVLPSAGSMGSAGVIWPESLERLSLSRPSMVLRSPSPASVPSPTLSLPFPVCDKLPVTHDPSELWGFAPPHEVGTRRQCVGAGSGGAPNTCPLDGSARVEFPANRCKIHSCTDLVWDREEQIDKSGCFLALSPLFFSEYCKRNKKGED